MNCWSDEEVLMFDFMWLAVPLGNDGKEEGTLWTAVWKEICVVCGNFQFLERSHFLSCQRTWGPDPGCIGKYRGKEGLHEDEYAYDIIPSAWDASWWNVGAKVHFIIQDAKDGIRDQAILNNSKRETCMGKAIPLNQVSRLQQRCGCGEPHVPEG